MQKFRLMMAASCALALGACSTFSFAPPVVEIDRPVSGAGGAFCGFDPQSDADLLKKDMNGALALVHNFLVTYRCAAREAADGRQVFEVPSLLALAIAGLGPSFGLDEDGRLAAVGGAAVYARGNSYYAPKDKARFLDSALDAVICVKTRAVGVGFLDTREADDEADGNPEQLAAALARTGEERAELNAEITKINALLDSRPLGEDDIAGSQSGGKSTYDLISEKTDIENRIQSLDWEYWELSRQLNSRIISRAQREERLTIRKDVPGGDLEVNIERQYYDLVSGSLFAIERVLARRLSEAGGDFDASGLAAEFEQLSKKKDELEQKKDDAEGAQVQNGQDAEKQVDPSTGIMTFKSEPAKNAELVRLDLAELQTHMQECVVRAKI